MSTINDIPGIGPAIALGLADIGITSPEELSRADVATLTKVRGISEARAGHFIAIAKTQLAPSEMSKTRPATTKEAKKAKAPKDKPKSKKDAEKNDKKAKKAKKNKKKAEKSGADKKPKKNKKEK